MPGVQVEENIVEKVYDDIISKDLKDDKMLDLISKLDQRLNFMSIQMMVKSVSKIRKGRGSITEASKRLFNAFLNHLMSMKDFNDDFKELIEKCNILRTGRGGIKEDQKEAANKLIEKLKNVLEEQDIFKIERKKIDDLYAEIVGEKLNEEEMHQLNAKLKQRIDFLSIQMMIKSLSKIIMGRGSITEASKRLFNAFLNHLRSLSDYTEEIETLIQNCRILRPGRGRIHQDQKTKDVKDMQINAANDLIEKMKEVKCVEDIFEVPNN